MEHIPSDYACRNLSLDIPTRSTILMPNKGIASMLKVASVLVLATTLALAGCQAANGPRPSKNPATDSFPAGGYGGYPNESHDAS